VNRFDYLKEKEQELGLDADPASDGAGDSDDERVAKMRELAKRLSQMISKNKEGRSQTDSNTEVTSAPVKQSSLTDTMQATDNSRPHTETIPSASVSGINSIGHVAVYKSNCS